MAGFAPRSVDTSPEMAGFGFDSLRRPRPCTATPGGFQIAADRLATDSERLLDAPKRPPEQAEREDLLLLVVGQWSATTPLSVPSAATVPAVCRSGQAIVATQTVLLC